MFSYETRTTFCHKLAAFS